MATTKIKAQKKENLLIEIGTEEIPARFLQDASKLFKELIVELLQKNKIGFTESKVKALFTPRRLVVYVPEVSLFQEDRAELIKGPPLEVAMDAQGQWTKAAVSFCERNSVSLSHLVRRSSDKGEYVFIEKKIVGRPTIKIFEETLGDLIQKIRFPKSMHWSSKKLFFARPIRWIVAILGLKIIRFKLDSISSGRTSFGYRWSSNPKVTIPKADLSLYLKVLQAKSVYANFDDRLRLIEASIQKFLGFTKNIHDEDREILMEVTNLVEYPNVGIGKFDQKFLPIPTQVLSTAIKYHQKYLPIYDQAKKLLPNFLVVFNGPRDISKKVIRGNERVLRARLEDAAFFWENDRKINLADRVEDLKHVVFQEKVGTYFNKMERLVWFTKYLQDKKVINDATYHKLERSAHLCKADLVTGMVGEFPSLQGIIGREYALISGEDLEVAEAIREHYLPLSGTEGELPKSSLGSYLALMDKLDTVLAGFKVGLVPSGSQDPYGLRRLSSGLLRILYEKNISLSLKEIIRSGLNQLKFTLGNSGEDAKNLHSLSESLLGFLKERLENLFLSLEFDYDLVRSVVDRQSDNPARAFKILRDLQSVRTKSFFLETVTLVERTFNITKGAKVRDGDIEEKLLRETEELELYRVYKSNYDKITKLIEQGNFIEATSKYADVFYEPVHLFFDKVLVNVEEESLRQNRYVLLKMINELYSISVADLSKVARPALATIS
jgi:glycyl-tRNA synthetase beta chain